VEGGGRRANRAGAVGEKGRPKNIGPQEGEEKKVLQNLKGARIAGGARE